MPSSPRRAVSASSQSSSSSESCSSSTTATTVSLPPVELEAKNEVMYLNELVTAEFDSVTYELRNGSSPFEMVAVLRFARQTVVATGCGARKKEAKRAAAAAILTKLGRVVPRVVKVHPPNHLVRVNNPSLAGYFSTKNAHAHLELALKHRQDAQTIFVAIDIEAWEQDPSIITEIAVVSLRGRGVRGEQLGIWAEHALAEDYPLYLNTSFVKSQPESFDFGLTTLVPRTGLGR